MIGKLKSIFGKSGSNHIPTQEEEEENERNDMISGVVQLDEKIVKEVMVPRIDVQFLSLDTTYDEIIKIITDLGFSRYPVYDDSIDNIVGILYAKDLIHKDIEEGFSVSKYMREVFFVPESKHLDDLLRDFKAQKVHIAVAVDEYGGVSGIVCMEDIIEVIVGEIQDEFDDEDEAEIIKVDDRIYLCDARINIEDLNEELKLSIPEDDFETLGGYVFELFGCIPKSGESISTDQADFLVESIDGHKINKIRLTLNNTLPIL